MRTLPITTLILALIAVTGGCSDQLEPEYTITCYRSLDGKKQICEKSIVPKGDAAIRMKGSLE